MKTVRNGPKRPPMDPKQKQKAFIFASVVWAMLLVTYLGLAIHYFTCPL